MKRYLADTHSLVWYFINDERLGERALEVFENDLDLSLIFIPTIVLAELLYISKKGRITLSFKNTIKRIEESDKYEIIPLDVDVLLRADTINNELEMHDKLIIATALNYNATLITKDKDIMKAGLIDIVW